MNPNNFHLLQGSLPQAPDPVQGYQVQRPVLPQTGGTIPYKQGPFESVLAGLTGFVNQYKATKDQQKAKATSEAERDLRLLQMNVPVNLENLAKNLKKSGLELDYENPVPNPQQPAQQIQVPTNSPIPGQGMMQSAIPQGMMPGQAPPQSLWDKVKGAVGLGQQRPVGDQSPVMNFLRQQQEMGRMRQQQAIGNAQLEFLTMDNAKNAATIMKGVYSGDPKAMNMARETGLLQRTPYDEYIRAARKGGINEEVAAARYAGSIIGEDKLKISMAEMAGKLADRFGGNVSKAMEYVQDLYSGKSTDIQPGRTFQENLEIAKISTAIREEYPHLSQGMAQIMALARVHGDVATLEEFSQKVLKNLPSKSMLSMLQASTQLDLTKANLVNAKDEPRHRGVMERISKMNAETAQAGLEIRRQSNQISLMGHVAAIAGKRYDDAYRRYTKEDATAEEKKAAIQDATDSLNAMPELPIQVRDKSGKVKTVPWSPKFKAEEIHNFFSSNDWYIKPVDEITSPGKAPEPTAFAKKYPELYKFLSGQNWSENVIIPPMIPGQ